MMGLTMTESRLDISGMFTQHTDDPRRDATVAGHVGREPSTGDMDLEERSSLRRVVGLSTELTDITEVEYRQLRLERVVLVGVWTSGTATQAEASLVELASLAETAGSQVLDGLVQRRARPDPATFIGSGKVDELRAAVQAAGADTVIADGELSPGQLRQLEEKLKVKVIDRTALILDIFAQHARSRDGKAQVELAQLSYLLPRLRGWGEALSRQVGGRAAGGVGIGGRGPGETKIELDRRRIRHRLSKLRREIAAMRTARATHRGSRPRDEPPDTLTDTVGFVRHLPHQLVEAFRSTLEETAQADLLVHVVDASDQLPEDQIAAVRKVLVEIGEEQQGRMPPELLVVNKVDAATDLQLARLRHLLPDAVFVSAHRGDGIALLARRIAELLPNPEVEVDLLLPYTEGSLVARIHEEGIVIEEEHVADGTRLRARVGPELATAVAAFTAAPR